MFFLILNPSLIVRVCIFTCPHLAVRIIERYKRFSPIFVLSWRLQLSLTKVGQLYWGAIWLVGRIDHDNLIRMGGFPYSDRQLTAASDPNSSVSVTEASPVAKSLQQ